MPAIRIGAVMAGSARMRSNCSSAIVSLAVLTVAVFSSDSSCCLLRAISRQEASGTPFGVPRAPANWGAALPSEDRAVHHRSGLAMGARGAMLSGAGPILPCNSAACWAQGASYVNAPNPGRIRKSSTSVAGLQHGARGARSCDAMRTLSTQNIDDIARYYDSLPKARTAPARYNEASAPALVRVGDPLRNIAPCIGCHGGTDHKFGAPWLEGMPKEYLVVQLKEFRTGARRNDSHAQMRNMTRGMTLVEIEQVADFYARREKSPR